MSYNQTNTEYGTAGSGTTGQGTGTNIVNKVKEAIPGLHPNTNQGMGSNTGTGMGTGNLPSSGLGGTSGAYDTQANVGGLSGQGIAPGTGGMTTETTGHHGHHHHGHHHAGGVMGSDTTGTGTGGGVMGQVKQHIPGTTEHQVKQDMQGSGLGSGGAYSGSHTTGTGTGGGVMGQVKQHIPGTTEHQLKQDVQGSGTGAGYGTGTGAGYGTGTGLSSDVGTGVGGVGGSTGTHTSTHHTSTHHTSTGAGEETMKEKILKHVPGTEERAQYKATGTAAGVDSNTGAGTGRAI